MKSPQQAFCSSMQVSAACNPLAGYACIPCTCSSSSRGREVRVEEWCSAVAELVNWRSYVRLFPQSAPAGAAARRCAVGCLELMRDASRVDLTPASMIHLGRSLVHFRRQHSAPARTSVLLSCHLLTWPGASNTPVSNSVRHTTQWKCFYSSVGMLIRSIHPSHPSSHTTPTHLLLRAL